MDQEDHPQELSAQIEDAINEIPGLEPAISQPIRDNVLESISQIDGQIVIKVFGDDPAALRSTVNDVLRAVSHVRGVSRAFIDRAGEVPQLQIEVDRGRAARYGLNVADVEDVVETALGGKVGTEIWDGDRRYGVAVRLREQDRKDVAAIANVPVDTPERDARRQVRARLLRDVWRRIREPAACDDAAGVHRPDQRVPHLHPAVPRVRLRQERGDRARQHPARVDRRHRGSI